VLYRIIQAINSSYGLAVAWAYIAAFVASLALLFIFPQVTLLLFFLGLASLGLTIGLGAAIDAFTRSLARRSVDRGSCPRCNNAANFRPHRDETWICDDCGSEFKGDGEEVSARERSHFVEHVPDGDLTPIFDKDSHAEAWRGT
jgi:ribosomal protein L37AE/L43A